MKQLTFVLILALATFSQAFCKNAKKQERKVIPMVNFVPYDFTNHIKSQFDYSPYRSCLIFEKGKLYSHKSGSTEPNKEIDMENLRDYCAKTDSVFILSLDPNPSFMLGNKLGDYLGYFKNGAPVFYVYSADKTYTSIYDLIVNRYGSISKYCDRYTELATKQFFDPSSKNEVLNITNEAQALYILEQDFCFKYIMSPSSHDSEIFIRLNNLLSERLNLSKAEKDELKLNCQFSIKKGAITNATELPFDENALKCSFTKEQAEVIHEILKDRNLLVEKAYTYLANIQKEKFRQKNNRIPTQEELFKSVFEVYQIK